MILHYKGPLGDFDYDSDEYEITSSQPDSSQSTIGYDYLLYIGSDRMPKCLGDVRNNDLVGKVLTIHIPRGMIRAPFMFSGGLEGGKYIVISDEDSLTDCSYMFSECNAKEINVSHLNTSHVTDMSYMFAKCPYLTNIEIEEDGATEFITDNVSHCLGIVSDCDILPASEKCKVESSVMRGLDIFAAFEAGGIQI